MLRRLTKADTEARFPVHPAPLALISPSARWPIVLHQLSYCYTRSRQRNGHFYIRLRVFMAAMTAYAVSWPTCWFASRISEKKKIKNEKRFESRHVFDITEKVGHEADAAITSRILFQQRFHTKKKPVQWIPGNPTNVLQGSVGLSSLSDYKAPPETA
ncbi:hypothetical protein EVAR_36459_1 [Eumeta japonica]|uniref:Uncharacterized protein n=1 Tax=Eumeta variegata TaxID=151549 RepID=A0A4C1VPY3_EUMVA|nr:hypothetical protein EVAR_36459_1 [Eumeta japonica]